MNCVLGKDSIHNAWHTGYTSEGRRLTQVELSLLDDELSYCRAGGVWCGWEPGQ